jgi:hypothetical protein
MRMLDRVVTTVTTVTNCSTHQVVVMVYLWPQCCRCWVALFEGLSYAPVDSHPGDIRALAAQVITLGYLIAVWQMA